MSAPERNDPTPQKVLLCHNILVGKSSVVLLGLGVWVFLWPTALIRELYLPPFSCIYTMENFGIIVLRHFSPSLQRQLRAIQTKNDIRVSYLNHPVSASFAVSISLDLPRLLS